MRGYRVLVATLLLAAWVHSGAATIIGVGSKTCGFYNEQIKGTPAEFYYESWAFGMLSTMNNFKYKFKETDGAAISGAFKQYCANHPLEQFAVAVLNVATSSPSARPK
jgi:hypothetical protein